MSTAPSVSEILTDAAGPGLAGIRTNSTNEVSFDDPSDVRNLGDAQWRDDQDFVTLRLHCTPEMAAKVIGLITGTLKIAPPVVVLDEAFAAAAVVVAVSS